MIKPIIILLLVLIIIFSIGISTNSKEGFVDYMNPMPEMVKDIRQTSDSDKMIILFEVYSNVQKHEKAMSIYDPVYKPVEVKMNPKSSILDNIKRLYPILYKQDKELIILTRNEYVPSKTLQQLMDGSLIKPMKDDLTKIMNYPARPIMDQPETHIPTILKNAKRYQKKADDIERIKQHKNYQFKFVISTEDDVLELFRDFVVPFNIPLKNVVCMPGLDDASNFEERTRFVMEMAKKYRFRGLTRLHIAAWNKTLNV
jgi:hypothetical protein